jgi:hypothetical protein
MSGIKDLILHDENMMKILAGRPLLEMVERGLSVDQIYSEIAKFSGVQKALKDEDETQNLRVLLTDQALSQMVDEVRELCLKEEMRSSDEHNINDESFSKKIEVEYVGLKTCRAFTCLSSCRRRRKFSCCTSKSLSRFFC